MNKTRIIAIATVIALAGAGQASAGGLLGLGILGNKTGVLNNNLNGTLSGVLNGNVLGILSGGGSDCGCKKRNH